MSYGVFFENAIGAEHGILLTNHLASSLEDASGDRAQYLLESLHRPVLAYERPSTGNLRQGPAFDVYSYLEDVDRRAQEIQRILTILAIEQVVICGNSAGALDALAIAATGKVNIEKVVAMEPVGLRDMPVYSAIPYLISQFEKDKTKIDGVEYENLPVLGAIRERASGLTLAKRIFKEGKAYGKVYKSDIGMQLIRILANEMPELPVDLILGERTHTTTPDLREQMLDEFFGTSVNIDILPNSTHSFADPNQHFVYIMKKALNLLPT